MQCIQWSRLKKDTTETKQSMLFRVVFSSQGKKYMVWINLEPCRYVLIREVSLEVPLYTCIHVHIILYTVQGSVHAYYHLGEFGFKFVWVQVCV